MAADSRQTATAGNPKGRQAVILIHGIGEQRPMETLRGFVDAFLDWESYHSKPDTISDSYELRRIKLRWVNASASDPGVNPDWPDTDFYEYYWAHLMYGTRITHVTNWIARTMIGGARAARNGDLSRDIYDSRLRWMIPLSWTIAAVAFALVLWFAVEDPFRATRAGAVVVGIGVLWKLVAPLLGTVLTDVVGDAARYLDVSPLNVARRYDIIRGGVDMLRKLHTQSDAEHGRIVYRYSRIVVIGHSLGSVIAYEVLKHFWAEVNGKIRVDFDDFAEVESFDGGNEMPKGAAIDTYPDAQRYRDAQARCWRLINRWWLGRPSVSTEESEQPGRARWLVSDLITLGSPLTYAPLLLADSAADFARRQALRELPTCPPDRSKHVNKGRFTVSLAAEDDRITVYPILGHQAMFAVTRWTNFYFTNDPIGGRLDKAFLRGIEEHDLGSAGVQWTPLHAHVSYWRPNAVEAAKPCVDRMREILTNVSLEWESSG